MSNNKQIPSALLEFFGGKPIISNDPSLLLCKSTNSDGDAKQFHFADSVRPFRDWAAYVSCSKCRKPEWLVCTICSITLADNPRTRRLHQISQLHVNNMAQISTASHAAADVAANTHQVPGAPKTAVLDDGNGGNADDAHFNLFDDEDDHEEFSGGMATVPPPTPVTRKRSYEDYASDSLSHQSGMSVMSYASRQYFGAESRQNGSGVHQLVGRAFACDANADRQPSEREAAYHLLSAQFCNSLKESQVHMYANLMSILVPGLLQRCNNSISASRSNDGVSSNTGPDNAPQPSAPPLFDCSHQPTSLSEIDLYYLKGKHSICQNIPYPSIRVEHGHAYSSIREIIENFVAHGMEIDEISLLHDNNQFFNCYKIPHTQ